MTMKSAVDPRSGPEDSAPDTTPWVPWVRTWGASPQAPDDSVGFVEPFENATLRHVVRISGGGRRVRLRISNEYGTAPLTIGAARVAIADTDGGVPDGSVHAVAFSGRPAITVPAGAPVLSDPVDLPAPALSRLAISLYLPGRVDTPTCHGTFHTLGWLIPGDAAASASLPEEAAPLSAQALITAVEVQPGAPTRALAVLGDSRVDGTGSTPGADRRWTDLLAERLAARGGRTTCVVNQGIGGNRMLADGIGTAALARFDRDVLATPGLGHTVIAVGNDLVFSFAPRTAETAGFLDMLSGGPVTADDIIAAHLQPAARARAHGVKSYAATIAPYGGSEMYSPEGERARRRVNSWIRTSGAFDGVLDFDAAWRDPDDPARIRSGLHAGDHIHGNDAGYAALARSIDLSLFD
ncbi:GDSL-type esterase/lipase family protein [Nocardiopsis suaedae]|uniref:GDSL-type esterase/lipase family protein n=1 Tax=Nocardiopsis suaedae TaxID=3018444 RepID=A0ABT4TTT3_9ACTN|nr:GDSL-type esterase/lipase family protein [Nocardiopsis suaedae]MDA2807567.1 GDSL-type esterase/lipase family protein [Nocardiopsis suaedae]